MPTQRISVVIATYNCDATLPVTLDSLLGQTRKADEIIIVDDHSATPAAELLGDLDPEIRIIRHETNKGVRYTRNTGFAEATGDYIFFLDGDDILCSEFLAVALDALEKNEKAGACFASFYKCFDGDAAPILASHREQVPDIETRSKGDGLTYYLNHTGAIIPSFSIFRKTALDDIVEADGLFSTDLLSNEDFHLFVRILAKYDTLWIKNPMGVYFLRPDSISRDQLKIWSSRAAAVASLVGLADRLSLSRFHVAFLKRMQASAMRQYARILANGGDRNKAMRCLVKELGRSPDLKTFAVLVLVMLGLQKKKIEYGGAEY